MKLSEEEAKTLRDVQDVLCELSNRMLGVDQAAAARISRISAALAAFTKYYGYGGV